MKNTGLYPIPVFIFLCCCRLSCRTGKDYQRPEVALPDRFSHQQSYSDTSSMADINWNNFFTDPELRQLIDSGIRRNYDLLLALNRIGMPPSNR